MNKVVLALLAVVALILPVTAAGAATASVVAVAPTVYGSAPGDEVFVTGNSNGKVVVSDNYYASHDLWASEGSYTRYSMQDIDYFWVPGGCDAQNIDTGYWYAGNKTYGPLNGSHYMLRLKVVC